MYHKLFSSPVDKVFLQKGERIIRELISDKLKEEKISLIIKNYQKRLICDSEFNSESFLLDLNGYLKYLELDRIYPYSVTSFLKESLNTLRQIIINDTFYKYGYWSAIKYQQGIGCNKKVYLDRNTNKVVRFYYSNPVDFFLRKLLCLSEADISKSINNNLLTVSVVNIPGEPIDITERALPLIDVFKNLYKDGYDDVINEIETIQESNILITDYIESVSTNVGLVIRLDRQGNKRVYVVAFDLDLNIRNFVQELEIEQQEIFRMKQQCFNAEPNSLDYEYLVKFIPELKNLTPQFSQLRLRN